MGGTLAAAFAAMLLGPVLGPLALHDKIVDAFAERGLSARAWFGADNPGFRPALRAVDNWRFEAAAALDIEGPPLLAMTLGVKADSLPRCIRLNNYWCIKRAGWAGEIAADSEGHVAFASAREGAVVAALLLRRYYVDYDRKDAHAIVSRWAPAECGTIVTARGRRVAAADALTTRGVNNTLRARYLAKRGAKGGKLRRSVVASRPLPMMRAPAIASGLGETVPAYSALRLASLEPGRRLSDASPSAPPLRPCAGETQRIAHYAARVVAGLERDGAALGPTDDLRLFDSAGEATDALARVMLNMASVEIGPWRAAAALAEQGIEGMKETVAARRREAERAEAGRRTQP